jgi:hypothetical protein
MYNELVNEMGFNDGLFNLLAKLRNDGFAVQSEGAGMNSKDIEEAWEHYLESPDQAVVFLETMHGFIFDREKVRESMLSLKDHDMFVRRVKILIMDHGREKAEEILKATWTFLDMKDVDGIMIQAVEEMKSE